MTETRKQEVAEWFVQTVLLFGGSLALALKTAGLFLEALEERQT